MTQPIAAFLTEDEFCARYRVSRDAARTLRRDALDPLPCLRVGRRFLYDPKQVEAWAADRARLSRGGVR
jgi:hypothetical protein